MKRTKLTLVAKAVTLVFACGLYGTASAAIVQDVSLGAQAFVDQFNSMNNGQGMIFNFELKQGPPPAYKITIPRGYESPDRSAYPKDRGVAEWYFSTFKATVTGYNEYGVTQGAAKLDYNSHLGTTSAYVNTQALPTTLSVGAAYLYTMYITEGMYGGPFAANRWDWSTPESLKLRKDFDYAWGLITVNDRIRLDGLTAKEWSSADVFVNNSVLNDLLKLNGSKDYWLAPYDPDKLYTEIGHYSVFVMANTRLTSSIYGAAGDPMLNMLFLANMIPEPETYAMMLAGLGLIGVIARRRRSKGQ